MNDIVRINGYHGTTEDISEIIISEGFKPSHNDYDWLGSGIYFFQDAPENALHYADRMLKRKKIGIKNLAVVGAVIRLEDCMDLLDATKWKDFFAQAYIGFETMCEINNIPMPRQDDYFRGRDRAVIEYGIENVLRLGHSYNIRVIRAPFIEGAPMFPGSKLFLLSHIQIAVRDSTLIERVWIESKKILPK